MVGVDFGVDFFIKGKCELNPMVAVLVQGLYVYLLTQRMLKAKIHFAHVVSACCVGREAQGLVVAQGRLKGRGIRWSDQPAQRAKQGQKKCQRKDGQPGSNIHATGNEVDVDV